MYNNINNNSQFPNVYPMTTPSVLYPSSIQQNYNPNAVFQEISSNTASRDKASGYNFDKTFTSNQPIIDKQTFSNMNNVIHNNMGDNLLAEHIVEYRINIDSYDRDINVYPDPFQFNVVFGGASKNSIKKYVLADPSNRGLGRIPQKVQMSAVPQPYINRSFENIKYIRLENIILPKFTNILKDVSNDTYSVDTTTPIHHNRFNIMVVKELDSPNNLGTNYISESGFVLINDKHIGENYFSCLPFYTTRTYTDALLGNINKLSISFYDSFGEQIEMGIFDSVTGDKINEPLDTNPANSANANNAYNKNIQNHITFIFGIVENQMNINTKYEK
jgi:hypothetical protein